MLRHVYFVVFLSFLALKCPVFAQSSTFDTNTEGWTTDSDGSDPVWVSTGGNPDGHITAFDISTGGTWHWVAPPAFIGNLCASYGRTLSYDIWTSQQQNSATRADVIISGNNMELVYKFPFNPTTFWTTFSVVLKEDAGWRINSTSGLTPTREQFIEVLTTVSQFRIRGEYLQSAVDDGALDNVLLSSASFAFDLDDNDSTTPAGSFDFRADSSCTDGFPIADLDLRLNTELSVDSIVIQIQNPPDGTAELLTLQQPLPAIGPSISGQNTSRILLQSVNGQTTAGQFREVIRQIRYQNDDSLATPGVRLVSIVVYTICGPIGLATAALPFFPPPRAGQGGRADACPTDDLFDLRTLLSGVFEDGRWEPEPAIAPSFFDPLEDTARTFLHIVDPVWSGCPSDTAVVQIRVAPTLVFNWRDTTLCRDEVLTIQAPLAIEFTNYQWNTGASGPSVRVADPGGLYAVSITSDEFNCAYVDSMRVTYVTCEECPVYIPNVFSPNEDGENDFFRAFAGCTFLDYHLLVFDRWGGLVFESRQAEQAWFGAHRSQDMQPGVYVWLLDYSTELFGQPLARRKKGDVLLIR
jgi:gliding motility-associated-like protein